MQIGDANASWWQHLHNVGLHPYLNFKTSYNIDLKRAPTVADQVQLCRGSCDSNTSCAGWNLIKVGGEHASPHETSCARVFCRSFHAKSSRICVNLNHKCRLLYVILPWYEGNSGKSAPECCLFEASNLSAPWYRSDWNFECGSKQMLTPIRTDYKKHAAE